MIRVVFKKESKNKKNKQCLQFDQVPSFLQPAKPFPVCSSSAQMNRDKEKQNKDSNIRETLFKPLRKSPSFLKASFKTTTRQKNMPPGSKMASDRRFVILKHIHRTQPCFGAHVCTNVKKGYRHCKSLRRLPL